jgi:hypothetical protein
LAYRQAGCGTPETFFYEVSYERRPLAKGQPVLSNKKLYNVKEKAEWILILKKIIGQDQQDF